MRDEKFIKYKVSLCVYYRLRKIPEIDVVGEPEVSVIAIASKRFNIFRLSDAMSDLGWSLNPLQFPSR